MTSIAARLAAVFLLVGTLAAHAQPSAKVHRIGVVSVQPGTPEPSTVHALRERLRELGHVEGKNLVLETRYAEGQPERLPGLFAELIRLKVDVLVTGSLLAALAAKKATTSVPIVVAGVLDVVSTGIVASLARPGTNITAATFAAGAEIAGKWVELLKEAVPTVSRVAVLLNSADPQSAEMFREVQAAARSLKVNVDRFDVGELAELDKAFAAVGASGAQGMIVIPTALFGGNRGRLIRFAAERRLPAIYFFNPFPDEGGLMSYGGSVEDSYRRAANYVDRILKGAKPADLPIDQPTRFELVINLKTAKALGLAIPRTLLLRADRVIE